MFLGPALLLNLGVMIRNSIYFYAMFSYVVNIYLKEDGRTVIVETLNGSYHTIAIRDIYREEHKKYKIAESRINIRFGTAKYMYIMPGHNYYYYDQQLLDAILERKNVDTKHHSELQYEHNKRFTWDQSELIKMKSRKAVENIVYWPSIKTFQRMSSWVRFRRAKRVGLTMDFREDIGEIKLREEFKYFESDGTPLKVKKKASYRALKRKPYGERVK